MFWKKKHLADFRGILPLYFIKLYYCVMVGVDIRHQPQNLQQDRRQMISSIKNIRFLIFTFLCILSLMAVILYGTLYVSPRAVYQGLRAP